MASNNTTATSAVPKQYVDGFTEFSAGMDSGQEPLELPKNQYAWGVNTTVRGRFVTHRPPYQIQKLILDTGIDLAGELFQGACYYAPDFGAESIVAQIGGRLYQFVPDTTSNVYVYDRTVKSYANEFGFTVTSATAKTNAVYQVALLNLTDNSGASYPIGTALTTDPSCLSTLFATATSSATTNSPFPYTTVNYLYTLTIVLQPGYVLPANITGKVIVIGNENPGQQQWTVVGTTPVGGNPALQLTSSCSQTATSAACSASFTYVANNPVFTVVSPSPPQVVGNVSTRFTAPTPGTNQTANLTNPYPGAIGDFLIVGNGLYQVTGITTVNPTSGVVTSVASSTSVNTSAFTYDPNPTGALQAWLWQAENYVIVNDGQSRPVVFNGVSSQRSLTPTFVGTLAGPFLVPKTGFPVTLILSAPFKDAPGIFINLTPTNFYPFLMVVTATNVGGNPNAITAINITGQANFNFNVPVGTPVASASTPAYYGVLANTLISTTAMPAIGSSLTLNLTPPFNGSVGDTLILTDGGGPLTEYNFTVTAILAGGSSVVVTNLNAPKGLIVNAGYPVVSANLVPDELPVGRMGAYVQGRNWISSPDGKYFIASDLVGSSSGTKALSFRDAVLKWSQNTTHFNVPGEAGTINCIIALNALDASLGQGPLQILCDNDIFTCSAPTDATQWASVTSPILSESIIGYGGTGQSAAVVVNGDLLFKSGDATIHSLKLVRGDFNQWGSLPISQEMTRVVSKENLNQLNYIAADEADNRLLMSCMPIASPGGVYSQGFIALDFDVTSSLQGKLPSVYDGVWTDLNILEVITGKFNKVNRTFVFSYNPTTNTVELWEILKKGEFDNGTNPINWYFETGCVYNAESDKPEFELVSLEDGEMYYTNLVGSATVNIWYRPDYDNCWHFWKTVQLCADNQTQTNADLNTAQYRPRVGLGKPPSNDYDPTVDKPARVGRFFQLRVAVTGSVHVGGIFAKALPYPESLYARTGSAK